MSRLFFAVMISVPVLAALPASAQNAQDAPWVKLVHADTGKVLTITDKSEEAEARVTIVKDDGSDIQQWKLVKDGNYYKIVNHKTGMVLDVYGESLDEGT